MYKGKEIESSLIEGAKPRCVQPRSLKEKLEKELNRLEKEGIIRKMKYSEWGASIVTVIKPSGEIKIYGDYKVTVNQE